jgi:hypothetical protein
MQGWEVSNPDPMSYNAPGEERRIDAKRLELKSSGYLVVKPYSITLIQFAQK